MCPLAAAVEYPDLLNVSSSDGVASEMRPGLFGIYEMVQNVFAEGRPVWKNSVNSWHFYYNSNGNR